MLSGRRPGAGPSSEPEPGAWFGAKSVKGSKGSKDTRTAGPPPLGRAVRTRPFFSDGPASGPLPGAAPNPGLPLSGRSLPGRSLSGRPLSGRPLLGRPLSGSRENSGEPAGGHDPHEVTVQLDSASVGPDGRTVQPGKGAPTTAEASDRPVFVDASGRRSRRFRRLGMLVAVACAVYAVVIVTTLLSGNSNAPWLPVPGQEEDTPAGRAETSPRPTRPVNPSAGPGATAPGAVATATDGATPSFGPAPTASASVSASASATGASSSPEPSASATRKSNPGVTTKSPAPDPEPSSSADGRPTPSAPVTTPGGTPTPPETTDPTGSTGAVGEGTGTG
ncbi:hypothetical protein ABZ871_24265 [Streptomyces populi]